MNYLHEELTAGFKVILDGKQPQHGFEVGDILGVSNFHPDDGEFALIKKHGQHEIIKYQENDCGVSAEKNFVGTIDRLERGMVEGLPSYLGDNPDSKHAPRFCTGCNRLEAIEAAGVVGAYCFTQKGLKKISSRCLMNKRRKA